jgi:hypothetical protein
MNKKLEILSGPLLNPSNADQSLALNPLNVNPVLALKGAFT